MFYNATEALILTLCEINSGTRAFIIFGSITFLWLILALIYLFIQVYRYCREKKHDYLSCFEFFFNRSKDELLLDGLTDEDERLSVLTSMSWLSNQTKIKAPSIDSFFSITPTSGVTSPSCLSRPSQKSSALPTVMVTDCDRLQTDIIELEHFDPSPPRRCSTDKTDLRVLLNDRMP